MSQDSLTALLGIHDEGLLDTYSEALSIYGYSVTKAPTPEEMTRLAEQNQHYAYIMDLNFGKPGSTDITPAVNVYDIVKSRAAGKSKFVGISSNLEAVDAAKQRGIPAFYKTDFDIVMFAKEPHI